MGLFAKGRIDYVVFELSTTQQGSNLTQKMRLQCLQQAFHKGDNDPDALERQRGEQH